MLPVVVLNLLGPVVIAPSGAGLTFSGGTPTVSLGSWTQRGSLLLGLSLNVTEATSTDTTVTPSSGGLTLSGLTPTVVVNGHTTVSPASVGMSLAGATPALAVQILTAQAGLTFSGGTPGVFSGYLIAPSGASLSLSPGTPTATKTAGCRAFGPLAVFGLNLDPMVGGSVVSTIPAPASLSLSGGTPYSIRGGVSDLGWDELVSAEATFDGDGGRNVQESPWFIIPSTTALTISGGTPTIINSMMVYPPQAGMLVSGKIPYLGFTIPPSQATLTLVTGTPVVINEFPPISPGGAALSFTGYVPSSPKNIQSKSGDLRSQRGFIVKYYDQFGDGDLEAIQPSFTYDINRGAQGSGSLVAGAVELDASVWSPVITDDETWTTESDLTETWTTVTDSTEEWTNG